MGNKVIIDTYNTKATVDEYKTKAVIDPYSTKVTNIQMVAPQFLLDSVSDIELAFAPWKISGSQTDILKVRRSSDDSEDIIQADSNGVISDESIMKTSGQDLRTWTNDYSDTLFVVEYFHPTGASNEQPRQGSNADQPEFDPINWRMIHDSNNHVFVEHNTIAPDKWEPFFQNDFAITFYCKRDDVRVSGVTEIGYIQRGSEDVLTILRAGVNGSERLQGIYWAGPNDKFNTDGGYDPYDQKNTNYFTVTFLARFTSNEGQLIYNGDVVETVDISGIDPSGWDVSISQLGWNIGDTFLGKVISHAMYPEPTPSRVATIEEKLKQPVNAYTAFFVENNDGYVLVVSVLERQSFYQNRSCRIRRSSDNAEVNVLWDSNNELSNSSKLEGSGDDLGTWAGSDTLFVPKVFDASGYEDHLAQSDTSKQPTLDIASNQVVFASGDELVTEVSGFTVNSDFQTIQRTELGEQPIESIKTTAEFYNEIRLETGYSDGENVEPLTNFADSNKPNGTQGTPSKIPEYVANDINGYPSILMDGVDDFYDLGDTYEDVFRGTHGIVTVVKLLDGGMTGVFMGARDDTNANTVMHYISSNEMRTIFNNGGNNTRYESNNTVFVNGENPWHIVGFLWDFENDEVRMRVDNQNIANSLVQGSPIEDKDPTTYSSPYNPYLFGRNNQDSLDLPINARFAAPPISLHSFADFENAFTKLNEKYAIY